MGAHEPNPLREARTGLVTLGITLGVTALLIVLSTMQWSSRRTYRVGFKVTQDATNIVPGTPVVLGGLQWGEVTRVQHAEFRATGSMDDAYTAARAHASRGTLVEFELDPRIELHPGALITRSATFLGSNVALVIADTGNMRGGRSMPGAQSTPIDQGVVLAAADPVDTTVTLLGLRASRNLKRLPELYDELKAGWSRYYTGEAWRAWDTLRGEAIPVRDDLRTRWPEWSASVDRTKDAFDRLHARFAGSPGQPGLEQEFESGGRRVEAAWDGLAADTDALRKRFENDAERQATALWRRANTEWTRMKDVGAKMQAAGLDSIDAYHDFMADSSLMGGQVSRIMNDLLFLSLKAVIGAGVSLVDHDMVARLEGYEAASRLVIATDELRRANDALEALAADAASARDPALSQELREDAIRAVTTFRTAVERLAELYRRR